jgi:hypothetical protein
MLTTVHLLAGALIGKYFKSVWVIILLAILSHYILDFIPHFSHRGPLACKRDVLGDKCMKKVLLWGIEPVLGIILTLFLIYLNKERAPLMVLGAFFAWFPDLLSFISWELSYKYNITFFEKLLPRPGNFLYNEAKSLFVGISTQIIVALIAILGLLPRFLKK